jgi:cell division protein FtsL
MVLFAFTAVTWWFWTIITVKYIITTMSSATTNLLEVKQDLKDIRESIAEEQNGTT